MKEPLGSAASGVAGVFTLPGAVKYFKCIATTGTFRIRYAQSEMTLNNPGDGFGSASSATYARLTFYNDGGAPVTATIYSGLEPSQQATTAVSSEITATATITNTLDLCAEATVNQFAVTTNVGTVKAFTAAATYFRWALIYAAKSLAGAANISNVQFGFSSTANNQPIMLAPGDQYIVPIPMGAKVNFQNLYLAVANNGDGVVVLFF